MKVVIKMTLLSKVKTYDFLALQLAIYFLYSVKPDKKEKKHKSKKGDKNQDHDLR